MRKASLILLLTAALTTACGKSEETQVNSNGTPSQADANTSGNANAATSNSETSAQANTSGNSKGKPGANSMNKSLATTAKTKSGGRSGNVAKDNTRKTGVGNSVNPNQVMNAAPDNQIGARSMNRSSLGGRGRRRRGRP